MRLAKVWTGYALLLLTSFSLTLRSDAQTVFGGLTGTVTDVTGAVVAGANVQAIEETTGTKLETISTSAGSYRFPQVPIGTFDVNVSAPGFQPEKLTGIQVNLQVTAVLNVTLKVGTATESRYHLGGCASTADREF